MHSQASLVTQEGKGRGREAAKVHPGPELFGTLIVFTTVKECQPCKFSWPRSQ